MATHASMVPKGSHGPWVSVLAALVLVAAIGGVAFAVGRNSAPHAPQAPVAQSNLDPQVTGMMPWMQQHVGDIAWMQGHMGDVAWMRSHWDQWQWMQGHSGNVRWMQTHPAQWSWMQGHMGDIGWMHDHWNRYNGWRSSMGYGTGTGSNGSSTGWNCGQWC